MVRRGLAFSGLMEPVTGIMIQTASQSRCYAVAGVILSGKPIFPVQRLPRLLNCTRLG
jgi:hypothetical protein